MKNKQLWTNYKIYAFILGVITGTIVYNYIGIDYSFAMISKVNANNFFNSLLYVFVINLKFTIFIFVLSFFKLKTKLMIPIIFYYAFLMSGFLVLTVSLKTTMLLSGAVISIFKMMSAIFMFDERKKVRNRFLSFLIMISGSFFQNFLLNYF